LDPNAKDDYGETTLHRVAINGNKPIALMLLKSGALIDAVKGYCQTPLHWAAWSENYGMVGILLTRGADINAANGGGETAIHYAASDHPKMLKYLLHEGAYHEVRSLRGETTLDWAVSDSARECVDALLEADALAAGALGNMRFL
jgi:ankyrin repeat protein